MEERLKPELAKPELEWNVESAEMAYGVIGTYVEHTQISGIIIALLASALGEERVAPIVQGQYWQAYMASKRNLIVAKEDIERLTALIEKVRGYAAPAAE
ncbi:MAG: hypothetical protein M3X11_08000 [Acidobacteriota bacterium]|nr:hypothetical protein [Acidobacteriota bacterium]